MSHGRNKVPRVAMYSDSYSAKKLYPLLLFLNLNPSSTPSDPSLAFLEEGLYSVRPLDTGQIINNFWRARGLRGNCLNYPNSSSVNKDYMRF